MQSKGRDNQALFAVGPCNYRITLLSKLSKQFQGGGRTKLSSLAKTCLDPFLGWLALRQSRQLPLNRPTACSSAGLDENCASLVVVLSQNIDIRVLLFFFIWLSEFVFRTCTAETWFKYSLRSGLRSYTAGASSRFLINRARVYNIQPRSKFLQKGFIVLAIYTLSI